MVEKGGIVMYRLTGAVSAVLLTLTLAAPAAANSSGNWNGMSGPSFAQCLADSVCEGVGECHDDQLTLAGDCQAACSLGTQGVYTCGAGVSSNATWGMIGSLSYSRGNRGVQGNAALSGSRIDANLFRLNATVSGSDLLPPPFFPPAEVALFRFDGDPAVFDGVQADDVSDLVALGLIAESDILFSTLLTVDEPLAEDIVVSGIPDEELVLFAAARAGLPVGVPATRVAGVLLLAAALLGLGTRFVLKRR